MSSKLIVNSIENTTGTHTINLDSGNSSIVGDLTVGGNLDLSSGGVYLGGSGSANLLDDYETGTWTPTLVGSGANPTVTYAVRDGLYTKIGNIVYINVRIQVSAFSGGADRILISGLPFTVSSSPPVYSPLSAGLCGNIDFGTGYTQLAPIFDVATTNINMLALQSNAGYRDLTVSNFSSSSFLSFAGFYRT